MNARPFIYTTALPPHSIDVLVRFMLVLKIQMKEKKLTLKSLSQTLKIQG